METIETLKPIAALDVLREAHADLEMVVKYGLGPIDKIDAEHISKAHQLIGLLLETNR